MECNKEEADQAVQIALKKFQENDMLGAKRFAQKAQAMYSELEGIHHLIEALNVHFCAAKVNGETDWYGILNVDPSASQELIKKAYRKMLLKVHPDKNKWGMADEAFRLVTEAYNRLSNQTWRALYDSSIKGKPSNQDPPVTGVRTSTSSPSPRNDKKTSNKKAAHPTSPPTAPCPKQDAKAKPQKGRKRASSKPQAGQGTSQSKSKTASAPRPGAFWTECPHCKYKFEYERIYINKKLICQVPECEKTFSATEISPPRGSKKTGKEKSASQIRQKSNKFPTSEDLPTSSPAFETPQVPPFTTETTGVPIPGTTNAEHGEKDESLKEAAEDVFTGDTSYHRNGKRAATHLQNETGSSGDLPTKKYKNGTEAAPPLVKVPFGEEEPNGSGSHPVKKLGEEATELLKQKAKEGIRKKLTEWSNTAAASSKKPHKVPSSAAKGNELKESPDSFAGKDNVVDDTTTPTDASSTAMEVPEQDFHKFGDRTEWKFEKGQVWALYDDQHGMPRLYATVENVVSLKPFEVNLRWLHSNSNKEFGPQQWIASGFHKTSGVFHRGVAKVAQLISYFSHKVNCKRGSRGITHIYPKKGDVWAVYKNWSSDWDANVRDSAEVFNQYDIVEVLQDYSKETGVSVAPLIKVHGFKSVMQRNTDPASHMTFPKHEIFRLSHQIPFCPLTKDNYPQAPQGCIEIDLAAVPFEFAQVIATENPANGSVNPNEHS